MLAILFGDQEAYNFWETTAKTSSWHAHEFFTPYARYLTATPSGIHGSLKLTPDLCIFRIVRVQEEERGSSLSPYEPPSITHASPTLAGRGALSPTPCKLWLPYQPLAGIQLRQGIQLHAAEFFYRHQEPFVQ
jgi:hypothetical protein